MQTKFRYNTEYNNNVKLAFAHNRKMKNIVKVEASAIDNTIPSIKTKIGWKQLDASIKKI